MDLLRNNIEINRNKLYSDTELSKIDEFILLKGNNLVLEIMMWNLNLDKIQTFSGSLVLMSQSILSILIVIKKIVLIPPKFDDLYPDDAYGNLPDIEKLKK